MQIVGSQKALRKSNQNYNSKGEKAKDYNRNYG